MLAFDDQRGGGDFAYNDVIFEVSSIPTPVISPEPSSLVIRRLKSFLGSSAIISAGE